MLRRDLVCMQSCQSIHCSRTHTKWVCLWHLLSVNAQTSLSMRAVSPEPSLLSHMHKMGVHLVYPSIQCSDAHEHVCSLARAFTAHTCMHKMGVHRAYSFSQCSDAPEHAHSLVRAFAARTLTHLNVDKESGQSLCMFTNRISTYTISTKMLCDGSNMSR